MLLEMRRDGCLEAVAVAVRPDSLLGTVNCVDRLLQFH